MAERDTQIAALLKTRNGLLRRHDNTYKTQGAGGGSSVSPAFWLAVPRRGVAQVKSKQLEAIERELGEVDSSLKELGYVKRSRPSCSIL